MSTSRPAFGASFERVPKESVGAMASVAGSQGWVGVGSKAALICQVQLPGGRASVSKAALAGRAQDSIRWAQEALLRRLLFVCDSGIQLIQASSPITDCVCVCMWGGCARGGAAYGYGVRSGFGAGFVAQDQGRQTPRIM